MTDLLGIEQRVATFHYAGDASTYEALWAMLNIIKQQQIDAENAMNCREIEMDDAANYIGGLRQELAEYRYLQAVVESKNHENEQLKQELDLAHAMLTACLAHG